MKMPQKNNGSMQKEFFDEAPFLSRFGPITEKRGTVPPGYFMEFPQQILDQIKSIDQHAGKVVSLQKESQTSKRWYAYFAPQHAIAASAFFAILVWSFFHYKTSTRAEQALSGIAPTEIQEYLLKHADEVDETLIHTLAENNPIEKIEKNQITLYLEENLSPEEIEEI